MRPHGATAGSRIRHLAAAITAATAIVMTLSSNAPVLGAITTWTVTATPLTLTEGQAATVDVTVTALGGTVIGCVTIAIPAGFVVEGLGAPSPWVASEQAGPPSVVQFNVTSDPQRLTKGASATFGITVTPTSVPLSAWSVAAYTKFSPASSSDGLPLVPLTAFVIVPAPTPTPTPTPQPSSGTTPGPAATPSPTAASTPGASAASTPPPAVSPSPAPSAGGWPGPVATSGSAGGGSVQPIPASPSPPADTAGPGGLAASSSPAGSASPPPAALSIGSSPHEGAGATFGSLGPLDFAFQWLVPGFALAVPGVLLMLLIVIQGSAGAAWLPLVRRELGDFGFRDRPGRDTSGD